jgi:uncharacterized protein
MKLNYFEDPSQFYNRVYNYLMREEARHCLLLGIAQRLIDDPQMYDSNVYLASVEAGEDVVAVAVMREPYKLVISCQDLAAIEVIAENLHAQKIQLPGVSGQIEETLAFAKTWQNLSGQKYQLAMKMQIHQLQAVKPIVRAKGFLRNATDEDRTLLLQWVQEFSIEVFGKDMENAPRFLDSHLKKNTIYIWQDEIPVSFVCAAGSTPNGKRFGPVYTPSEYRQKGYATSSVADVSQKYLDMGCQFCFLFTDLANPTSNYIYRKIGYQPVTDCCEYNFLMQSTINHAS